MGTENKTEKKFEPKGPYSPPLPSEAEQEEGKPMAVAGDESAEQESFKPTTQSLDAMSPETAKRYRDPNLQTEDMVGKPSRTPNGTSPDERSDENKRMEHPPGYKAAPQSGYSEMDEDEVEKHY